MVATCVRTNETASQSPAEKITRTGWICYLSQIEICILTYISVFNMVIITSLKGCCPSQVVGSCLFTDI